MNIISRKIKAAQNIIVRNIRWQKDKIICRKNLNKKTLLGLENKKIVILAPHSDDEWIGCSQLLLKHTNDVTVINMDMQGGDNNELHELRFNEMQHVAKTLGYKLVTSSKNRKDFLCQFLKENPTDIVMLPCYYDWHDEHFAVMEYFAHAAVKSLYSGLVGMYQVSLPIPASMINYASIMGKNELRKKWTNFKKYYSSQSFLPTKRFMINEYINGEIASACAIESYSVNQVDVWLADYSKRMLSENEISMLKNNVNRIAFIRSKLQQKEEYDI